MATIIRLTLLAVLLSFSWPQQAGAVLQAFSGEIYVTEDGLVTGYPVWYQDFNDLKLELCALENGLCLVEPPLDPVLGVGPETFWWTSEAALAFAGGDGLLVLAMEAAFLTEEPIDGDQISFGRVRVRINVGQPGVYTVTHPFGTLTQTVGAGDIGPGLEINVSDDIGCLAAPCDFSLALGSNVGPFLFWNSDLPVIDGAGIVGDNFYLGNPGLEHAVLGSPFGTNVFRIERDGVLVAETPLFAVSGKIFTGDGNTIPVAEADAAATAAGQAVVIDTLANDTFTDIPINPGSLTISVAPLGGTANVITEDGEVKVRYTPAAGFTGDDSFTYTIRNFAGVAGLDESAPATVSLLVEDLSVDLAELRPRLLKWQIAGTSSDTSANSILLLTEPLDLSATLSGSQEVPPVASAGSGSALITPSADLGSLTFDLSTSNLLNTTAAHIHIGPAGVDGPIIFNLILTPNFATASGTLTAADLVPQPAQGINTFADAVRAVLSGQTYVNVHTVANAGGEIRGQVGPVRLISEAVVQPDGSYSFAGKSAAVPPPGGMIRAISSNGISTTGVPLESR
jgi:hypothetical protein